MAIAVVPLHRQILVVVRAGQCRVVLALRKSCAAFAIDGRKPCGPHGFASARQLGQAQNAALRQCYQYGGKDCVIRAWACDTRD